jgi:DNA modification methylase
MADVINLNSYLPSKVTNLGNPQTDIPRIAKDKNLMMQIEEALQRVPTQHGLHLADARHIPFIEPDSVHLIVTSPPYWILKKYRQAEGQMGFIADYETFLSELDKVWHHCHRVLVPGGRLICVVGDVCLSRRKNRGIHTVIPLHASIQEHCRKIGFNNLAPIIWHKIANANYEVARGSTFLGKPYEPNAVIKHDIEYILMERRVGGYRKPSLPSRVLSIISYENHKKWFQQIWTGISGASTKLHPAPFPLEIAERLIRMFSFAGDTVLDPFMGTGTTNAAAAKWGRNSIGIEVDPHYFDLAHTRLRNETMSLFKEVSIEIG